MSPKSRMTFKDQLKSLATMLITAFQWPVSCNNHVIVCTLCKMYNNSAYERKR